MKTKQYAIIFRNVQKLHAMARFVWQKACQFDGMQPETVFASFSKGNPYTKTHDRLMQAMQSRMQKLQGVRG